MSVNVMQCISTSNNFSHELVTYYDTTSYCIYRSYCHSVNFVRIRQKQQKKTRLMHKKVQYAVEHCLQPRDP